MTCKGGISCCVCGYCSPGLGSPETKGIARAPAPCFFSEHVFLLICCTRKKLVIERWCREERVSGGRGRNCDTFLEGLTNPSCFTAVLFIVFHVHSRTFDAHKIYTEVIGMSIWGMRRWFTWGTTTESSRLAHSHCSKEMSNSPRSKVPAKILWRKILSSTYGWLSV